jgi:hypothetical protein
MRSTERQQEVGRSTAYTSSTIYQDKYIKRRYGYTKYGCIYVIGYTGTYLSAASAMGIIGRPAVRNGDDGYQQQRRRQQRGSPSPQSLAPAFRATCSCSRGSQPLGRQVSAGESRGGTSAQ